MCQWLLQSFPHPRFLLMRINKNMDAVGPHLPSCHGAGLVREATRCRRDKQRDDESFLAAEPGALIGMHGIPPRPEILQEGLRL
jgi:hypothetical protein